MKIAKVFVLTLILALTTFVYASEQTQTAAGHDKAAACSAEKCCQAKPECCKTGAECCKEGAKCCKSESACCSQHDQCCDDGKGCLASATTGKADCCSKEVGSSKADGKDCCGKSCKNTASAKK
jgi:hypothetical protein